MKVWVAAEVLTASDLNAEHTGHINNENDLNTRLVSEISTRSTLETEHDTLTTNLWNSVNNQVADNRVGQGSIKDSAVHTAELNEGAVTGVKCAAAIKDPAVGTAGLRTLGTGALQALPGNTTILPVIDSITLEKIQHGTVMLPFFESTTDTEHTSDSDTYEDIAIGFRVYIPANATVIRMASRQKNFHGSVAFQGYLRFYVGENYSSTSRCHATSYEWRTDCVLNVAGLSGWYTMKIQMHRTGSEPEHLTYLQGFSFVWE